jgi:hypothetical protein
MTPSESVRALAEAQKPLTSAGFEDAALQFDFPALLLHLERAAKVVEAARELFAILNMNDGPDEGEYMDALDAALKEIDNAE